MSEATPPPSRADVEQRILDLIDSSATRDDVAA
jgi:hypothetical protein